MHKIGNRLLIEQIGGESTMGNVQQQQYVFGSILLLANKLQITGDKLFDDLTLKQWFLMIMIFNMENKSPAINEISEFTGTTRQNVKKMLLPLESKGYLTIHKSNSDARALNVQLTKKSFDYFSQNEKYGEELTKKLFKDINNDDLTATTRVLEKLMDNCIHIKKGEELYE